MFPRLQGPAWWPETLVLSPFGKRHSVPWRILGVLLSTSLSVARGMWLPTPQRHFSEVMFLFSEVMCLYVVCVCKCESASSRLLNAFSIEKPQHTWRWYLGHLQGETCMCEWPGWDLRFSKPESPVLGHSSQRFGSQSYLYPSMDFIPLSWDSSFQPAQCFYGHFPDSVSLFIITSLRARDAILEVTRERPPKLGD